MWLGRPSELTPGPRQDIFGVVIKFRCPVCRQKIRATDEQAGRSGPCPHCHESLTVPSQSDAEFLLPLREQQIRELEEQLAEARQRIHFLEQLQARTEAERRRIEEILQRNLVPQFAGFLEDKMMQKLREDHHQLAATQDAASSRVDDLEERLARAQEKLQQRFRAYEQRIAELEAQLRTVRGERTVSPLLSPSPPSAPLSL